MPVVKAVAGKKCGARPNSIMSTLPKWKTSSQHTKSRWMLRNQWFALMRNLRRCTMTCALGYRAAPGVIAKRDNEYARCGTANVFCAVEPKAGVHFTWPTPNRSAAEFAQVTGNLAEHYPAAATIHLVMDNLNIHCRKSLTDYYGVKRGRALWHRFTMHYTPKHGSWLNQAEIEISLFSRRCLGRRRLPTLKMLSRQATAWNRRTNRARVRINWKFDRKAARKKFKYEHFIKRS